MKLTPEIFEQNVAAYLADKAGKPWQYQLPNGKWIFTDCQEEGILWHIESWPCRPAPEPEPEPEPEPPKPWDCADDVPGPVCWIRKDARFHGAMVHGVNNDGIVTSDMTEMKFVEWNELASSEYSMTRAKNSWKLCVKEAK